MSVPAVLQLATFSKLKGTFDDDSVDRLNHIYTVVVLLIFAFLTTGSSLVGSPIACWTPANFPGSFMEYVRSYCWIKNTYYIPMDQSIPVDLVRRESEELKYYQWVPFILLFMAFLFKLPCFMWRLFNQASGINLDKINEMASSLSFLSVAKRREGVNHLAFYIDSWLRAHRNRRKKALNYFRQRLCRLLCVFGMKRDTAYLTLLYVVVKMLYVANIFSQFFLLNAFVGGWYGLYGVEVIRRLVINSEWTESPRFPTVTLCDFEIRQQENIQRYTVQCAININIYNDKIFVFLWFWLVFVGMVSIGSLLTYIWRSFRRQNHTDYITKYLLMHEKIQVEDEEAMTQVESFTKGYLKDDGLFVMRLLARNSNIVIVSLIIAELWEHYKLLQAQKAAAKAAGATPGASAADASAADASAADPQEPRPTPEETTKLMARS